MKSMTFGTVPSPEEFAKAWGAGDLDGYRMEFHEGSEEFMAFSVAIGQGIDSHLEAVRFQEFTGSAGRRGFRVTDPGSLRTLVRRLVEAGDEDSESLASCIITTLDWEWV
jgi:hypothetical protein